jgi:hypothetical protein
MNNKTQDIKIDVINRQCAPTITFKDGSCFKLSMLIDIANAYNGGVPNKNSEIKLWTDNAEILKPEAYKRYLVEELTQRLGKKQYEWYKHKSLASLNNKKIEEMEDFTFLPEGPQGKNEWLNNFQIKKYLKLLEIEYPSSICVDVLAMDFDKIKTPGVLKEDFRKYYNDGKHQILIVLNLDNHDESGSHWVALYANIKANIVMYYDSFGTLPEVRVRRLMRRIAELCSEINKIDILQVATRYNKHRHQYKNSECGVYSIVFLHNLLKKEGANYHEYCNKTIPDEVVEKCRAIIFRDGGFSQKIFNKKITYDDFEANTKNADIC